MSKRFKGKRCVYCGNRELMTGDHIFAREFFLVSERIDLPKVPACFESNAEKSKLEHYLTAVFPFGGKHISALKNLVQMVPKRLEKNHRLRAELADGQRSILMKFHGEDHQETSVLPLDEAILRQYFAMVVRGLLWFHWQVLLSADYVIESHAVTQNGERSF